MLIKFLLQVSRERRRLSFVVFICLLFLSCWLGFLVYNFVMGVWTRLLPWLEPPYLFLIVICMIFLVININNEKVEINYVTKYKYVSSFDSKDSKDDSTPSEKRSFSTSSTTSSSLRVRAEVNEKVEDYIKEVHKKWKCERQMDDSPWESPIRSPPPIHKMGMGKHQEGKKYREAFDEALVSLAHEQTLKKLSKTAASFNDEWWKAIIDGLFYETEIRYTKTQIKDRLSKLYSKWKAWNKVMNTPGFDWDPVGKTIRANDNNWTSYIKVNPESTKIRASTFPMYEELTTIFNSIDAASLESFTTSPRVNTNPNFNASHDLSDSSDCRSSSSGNNSIKTNNKGVTGNLHKLRRTGDFKPSDIGSSELLEVVKVLVELVKHKDRASARPTSDASSVSITACVKMLQEMEGVNNQSTSKFFFKAIDMFQSPGWREAFVAMTVDQRLRWLNNLKCV